MQTILGSWHSRGFTHMTIPRCVSYMVRQHLMVWCRCECVLGSNT